MPKSVKEGIPYIMTNNFTENGIDFKKAKKISQNDYALLSKKSKPQIGDVIIARYASVGETRLVKTDIPFVVSYSCALLRPSSSINNLFFYYSMKSPDVIRSIKINTKTGSQSNIGMEDLKKFVNLPTTDINEQKNIGELLGSIDNIISLNASKVKQLRQLKQALLQQMFI
jgi:type I restriction enzyme S subunit